MVTGGGRLERFSSILVVIGGEPYDATLTRGVALAMRNGARLTLIDVVAPLRSAFFSTADVDSKVLLQATEAEQRRQELLRIASEYLTTGIDVDVVVRTGNAAVEIVSEVISGGHDLVIKTANTRTGLQHLLGSVTRALMRTCPCPVWAIKPGSGAHYRQVLAAIDPLADDPEHLELNETILHLAASLARAESAVLHLVSVWSVPMERTLRSRLGTTACDRLIAEAEARVRRTVDRWHTEHLPQDLTVRVHVLRGAASERIAETAKDVDADLIVMGTVCRSGLSGLLVGNTAEHLLSTVTCGVLAIKPRGFVSPVQPTDRPAE